MGYRVLKTWMVNWLAWKGAGKTTCPICDIRLSTRNYRVHVATHKKKKVKVQVEYGAGGRRLAFKTNVAPNRATEEEVTGAKSLKDKWGRLQMEPVAIAKTPTGRPRVQPLMGQEVRSGTARAKVTAEGTYRVRPARAIVAVVKSTYRALNKWAKLKPGSDDALILTDEEAEDINDAFQYSNEYVSSPWAVLAIIIVPPIAFFLMMNVDLVMEKWRKAFPPRNPVSPGKKTSEGYVVEAQEA